MNALSRYSALGDNKKEPGVADTEGVEFHYNGYLGEHSLPTVSLIKLLHTNNQTLNLPILSITFVCTDSLFPKLAQSREE